MEFKNNKIQDNLVEIFQDKSDFSHKIGKKFKNLGDQVYEIVKNKIIYHEIKPGERVIDKHLAEDLGVSRSLVRQALTILEKEELVTSVPRSGFYVKEITKKDVKEIYDIRNILETAATKQAIPELSGEDVEEVNKIFEEAKRDLDKDKVRKFIEADARLHEMIINNCGNQRLMNLINQYNSRFIFYRIVDLSRVGRAKEAYFEHLDIFKAVKERDINKAAELMSKHIENAKNIILTNFDKYTYGG